MHLLLWLALIVAQCVLGGAGLLPSDQRSRLTAMEPWDRGEGMNQGLDNNSRKHLEYPHHTRRSCRYTRHVNAVENMCHAQLNILKQEKKVHENIIKNKIDSERGIRELSAQLESYKSKLNRSEENIRDLTEQLNIKDQELAERSNKPIQTCIETKDTGIKKVPASECPPITKCGPGDALKEEKAGDSKETMEGSNKTTLNILVTRLEEHVKQCDIKLKEAIENNEKKCEPCSSNVANYQKQIDNTYKELLKEKDKVKYLENNVKILNNTRGVSLIEERQLCDNLTMQRQKTIEDLELTLNLSEKRSNTGNEELITTKIHTETQIREELKTLKTLQYDCYHREKALNATIKDQNSDIKSMQIKLANATAETEKVQAAGCLTNKQCESCTPQTKNIEDNCKNIVEGSNKTISKLFETRLEAQRKQCEVKLKEAIEKNEKKCETGSSNVPSYQQQIDDAYKELIKEKDKVKDLENDVKILSNTRDVSLIEERQLCDNLIMQRQKAIEDLGLKILISDKIINTCNEELTTKVNTERQMRGDLSAQSLKTNEVEKKLQMLQYDCEQREKALNATINDQNSDIKSMQIQFANSTAELHKQGVELQQQIIKHVEMKHAMVKCSKMLEDHRNRNSLA